MSMEQAILEHAGALRELAAAIKSMGGTPVKTDEQFKQEMADMVERDEFNAKLREVERRSDAKLRAAAEKEASAEDPDMTRVIDKKELQAALDAAKAEKDAELEAAVAQVEEAAKPLDYQVDVRPVLMAVAKNKDLGAPKLKELLAKYGAPNGDKLKPTDYATILADANELLGN